jgi:hypothetical protein
MRFLFPTAGAAVLLVAALLFVSAGAAPAAAANPNTAIADGASRSGSGVPDPGRLTADAGERIGGRDTVAGHSFWKKFWKAFKAVIGGLITFIDGLIEGLGGSEDPNEGLPRGGYAGLAGGARPPLLLT